MTFYINPPAGNIALHKLTCYSEARLEFLCQIYSTDGDRMKLHDIVLSRQTVENSDCLIEGSLKDRISHFLLRLAFAGNQEMRDFLVSSETLLFDFRFSCMSKDELFKCLRSLDQHCNHHETYEKSMQTFLKIFADIKAKYHGWKGLIRAYLNGTSSGYLHVPFQTVLQLVAKRQVSLKNGIASVPISKLRELVTSLFMLMMSSGVSGAAEMAKVAEEDERIHILIKQLKSSFKKKCRQKVSTDIEHWVLTHEEIERNLPWFPACMSQLHRRLRQQHRLQHHDRIQYTLFLKEVGLPVHQALMFWQKEYSMPSNHGCCHNWAQDENRYIYNIRHLYGLEGSRINYRGHSCKTLQKMHMGAHLEGGCPFSSCDVSHLKQLMNLEGIQIAQTAILDLVSLERCSEACHVFLAEKIKLTSPRTDAKLQKWFATANSRHLKSEATANSRHLESEATANSCDYDLERDATANSCDYDLERDATANSLDYHFERDATANSRDYHLERDATANSRDYHLERDATANSRDYHLERDATANSRDYHLERDATAKSRDYHLERDATANSRDYHLEKDATANSLDYHSESEATANSCDYHLESEVTKSNYKRTIFYSTPDRKYCDQQVNVTYSCKTNNQGAVKNDSFHRLTHKLMETEGLIAKENTMIDQTNSAYLTNRQLDKSFETTATILGKRKLLNKSILTISESSIMEDHMYDSKNEKYYETETKELIRTSFVKPLDYFIFLKNYNH